jgi:phosphoglycolate phosphatase-like HAD superfamily hydrolase
VFLTRSVTLADEPEPETALLLARRHGDQVVVVGTSREDISDALQGVLTQLLIGGPLLLVLASAAGYLVAGAALRPVGRMEREAAQISAQRSAERLPLPTADDELRRLGVTLNAMLDRLDAALQTERRFVAEASHELRTAHRARPRPVPAALARGAPRRPALGQRGGRTPDQVVRAAPPAGFDSPITDQGDGRPRSAGSDRRRPVQHDRGA